MERQDGKEEKFIWNPFIEEWIYQSDDSHEPIDKWSSIRNIKVDPCLLQCSIYYDWVENGNGNVWNSVASNLKFEQAELGIVLLCFDTILTIFCPVNSAKTWFNSRMLWGRKQGEKADKKTLDSEDRKPGKWVQAMVVVFVPLVCWSFELRAVQCLRISHSQVSLWLIHIAHTPMLKIIIHQRSLIKQNIAWTCC